MAVGIRTYNNGTLILDETFRTGKILGITTMTDGVSGNTGVNTKFALGTPFWIAMPTDYYVSRGPTISFASNTISWVWGTYSGGANFQLIYGVY